MKEGIYLNLNKNYRFYIDGMWEESKSKEVIKIMSPYKDELVGTVQAISKDEADKAIQSAKIAQKKWEKLSIRDRGNYLYHWIEELEKSKEDIATTIMQEVGKGFQDAVKEVERTIDLIRFTIEEAIHLYGESMLGENFPGGNRSKIAISHRVPLGVVLAISPFNYPVNLSAAKIAPALISGNAVVFKPATQGAISGIKMIEALDRAGLPKGVLNVVTGHGSVIGNYLIEHQGIDMISFTGGSGTGKRIAKLANMIPLVMELGGKDPAIVVKDANLDLAAKQIVSGAFSYSGQRCTAIKRVFVDEMIADELIEKLSEELKNVTIGSPEENKMIVPLIDQKSADFVQCLIDDALEKNATLITGNQREGNLIYPTLLDHVTPNMRLAWEEPFGPVLPIIRVKTVDEAIEMSNQSEYGLQASIFSQDIDQAFTIAEKIQAGSVQINGRTERGPDHFPFIGTKGSGMGTQGVRRSIESMTREKVTVININ